MSIAAETAYKEAILPFRTLVYLFFCLHLSNNNMLRKDEPSTAPGV